MASTFYVMDLVENAFTFKAEVARYNSTNNVVFPELLKLEDSAVFAYDTFTPRPVVLNIYDISYPFMRK